MWGAPKQYERVVQNQAHSGTEGKLAMLRAISITLTVGAALSLAACANDTLIGSGATSATSALPPKPAVDPACATLASRIDTLRREGVVDRVEAAAKGKGTTVNVKRASLGQIAELEKANADFQAKCSTVPRAPASAAAPQAAPAAPAAVKTAAAAVTAKAPAQAAIKPTAVVKPVVKPAAAAAAAVPAAAAAAAPAPAVPKE